MVLNLYKTLSLEVGLLVGDLYLLSLGASMTSMTLCNSSFASKP
uniref:Uncharacterized protein n=1 Tax=Lupinus angustifolius TaxID=3871 RepID=L0P0W1_LUPAN|nr:hypothetical protein [Lupinus angustifolius]